MSSMQNKSIDDLSGVTVQTLNLLLRVKFTNDAKRIP